MDLSLFFARVFVFTVFGYKKRRLFVPAKLSYEIFCLNICLRLNSIFRKVYSTKISQKPLSDFENYSAELKCTDIDFIKAMQKRFRILSNS